MIAAVTTSVAAFSAVFAAVAAVIAVVGEGRLAFDGRSPQLGGGLGCAYRSEPHGGEREEERGGGQAELQVVETREEGKSFVAIRVEPAFV